MQSPASGRCAGSGLGPSSAVTRPCADCQRWRQSQGSAVPRAMLAMPALMPPTQRRAPVLAGSMIALALPMPVPFPVPGRGRAVPVLFPGPTPVRFPARGVAERCGAQPHVPPVGARCRLTAEAGRARGGPGWAGTARG